MSENKIILVNIKSIFKLLNILQNIISISEKNKKL
jgi:hypothetical protein